MNAKYAEDPNRTMKAAEWHGKEDIRVATRPAPAITDPDDAIVRITSMTICGSDLHMVRPSCPQLFTPHSCTAFTLLTRSPPLSPPV